jgi:hypothetical protein
MVKAKATMPVDKSFGLIPVIVFCGDFGTYFVEFQFSIFSSRLLLQSAIIDLIIVVSFSLIQAAPVSEGLNLYHVILGPLAQVNNLALETAAGYYSLFLFEFAKYAVAVPYFYRWLVICR